MIYKNIQSVSSSGTATPEMYAGAQRHPPPSSAPSPPTARPQPPSSLAPCSSTCYSPFCARHLSLLCRSRRRGHHLVVAKNQGIHIPRVFCFSLVESYLSMIVSAVVDRHRASPYVVLVSIVISNIDGASLLTRPTTIYISYIIINFELLRTYHIINCLI
jgi:hypothetical protein